MFAICAEDGMSGGGLTLTASDYCHCSSQQQLMVPSFSKGQGIRLFRKAHPPNRLRKEMAFAIASGLQLSLEAYSRLTACLWRECVFHRVGLYRIHSCPVIHQPLQSKGNWRVFPEK